MRGFFETLSISLESEIAAIERFLVSECVSSQTTFSPL